jgi:AraC family transcriptional activator of pobA
LKRDIPRTHLPEDTVAEVSSGFLLRQFAAESIPISSDAPHRHDYQEILVIKSGQFHHAIDGNRNLISGPGLSLITKGQVHVVLEATDLIGWVVQFTDAFLPSGLVSGTWNYATLFNQIAALQDLALERSDMETLEPVLDLLAIEYKQAASPQKDIALRHLLSLLIIQVDRIYQKSVRADRHERDDYRTYQQFTALLEQDFSSHHDVLHYAEALMVEPVKLSRIISRITGKSTKQIIDERVVLEAKRYMTFTDISIKEIASLLGFSDQFHLSRTFKRITGLAPQSFRERHETHNASE